MRTAAQTHESMCKPLRISNENRFLIQFECMGHTMTKVRQRQINPVTPVCVLSMTVSMPGIKFEWIIEKGLQY